MSPSCRKVEPEELDGLAADDPRGRRSRRDLRRVHVAMRSISNLQRAVAALELAAPPRRILELGAGDGTLLLRFARALAPPWRGVELTLLDRVDLVSARTHAGYRKLGWQANCLRADALVWAASPQTRRYDLCFANLFLHHFEAAPLRFLLRAAAAASEAFVACEPRRSNIARLGSRLIVLLGASAVTRQDAVKSVAAGFTGRELSAEWSAPGGEWNLAEFPAPPFSHCLAAARAKSPRHGSIAAEGAMNFDCDALVIGAGPAGTACAILLAQAGWRVIIVEQHLYPRRKVCGECIAAGNLELLDRLGIGADFRRVAGPELRRIGWMGASSASTADMPPCPAGAYRYGRAVGRDWLDAKLLQRAASLGVVALQPARARAVRGELGGHVCTVDGLPGGLRTLRAPVVVDAHGSWERGPRSSTGERAGAPRIPRKPSDLLAFKANFRNSALAPGFLPVLAVPGGYGGMVVANGGLTTLACCLRRDAVSACRAMLPHASAGAAVEALLRRSCSGVHEALKDAQRDGNWLSVGPLRPGIRVGLLDGVFRVGNAAGESHALIGEGISMALQSSALLAGMLTGRPAAAIRGRLGIELQRCYATAWRRAFASRLRLAALYAHVAMRPRLAEPVRGLLHRWPILLRGAAQLAGKTASGAPGPRPHHTEMA